MKLIDNSLKTHWNFVVIVVVLGLVFGSFALWYVNSTSEELSTVNIPKPTSTLQPQIDTSDWQTYRNDEFGFEVKYPNDWFNITNEGLSKVSTTKIYEFSNKNKQFDFHEEDMVDFVIGVPFGDDVFFEKIQTLKSGSSVTHNSIVYEKIRNEIVAGYPAIRYRSNLDIVPLAGDELLVKVKNRIFYFALNGNSEASIERNKEVFDQILDTFRFVE